MLEQSFIYIKTWVIYKKKSTKAWPLTAFCGKNCRLYSNSAIVHLPILPLIIDQDSIYLIKSIRQTTQTKQVTNPNVIWYRRNKDRGTTYQ